MIENLNPKKKSSQVYQRVNMADNAPWFVVKDVCDILEIVNSRTLLALLDDDEKASVHTMDTSSSSRATIMVQLISEPGLYTLAIRFRKPKAKLKIQSPQEKLSHPTLRSLSDCTFKPKANQSGKIYDNTQYAGGGNHYEKNDISSI